MDVSTKIQSDVTLKSELVAQQQEVRKLAARDREVRAHEMAHAAVGGAHASQPHYEFAAGPNGVRYAASGHVNIDVSPVAGDPAATLKKMQTVAKAALAPAQPSSADRAVAAKAKAQAAQARAEMAAQAQEQMAPSNQSAHPATARNDSSAATSPAIGSLIDIIA